MTGNTLLTCRSSDGGCTNAQQEGVSGNATNNNRTLVNVDIDDDPSTFNSSSADLSLPSRAVVLFAGLAWGGIFDAPNGTDTRARVRLKVAGSSDYANVNGTILGEDDDSYMGIADVTSQVKAAGSGTYTVANVMAETGNTGGGRFAGWSLVVVYQDLTLPLRNLVVYSGFGSIQPGDSPVSTTISGFVVPPSGTTVASVGFIGLEGDRGLGGDSFRLNGKALSDDVNRSDNAMSSTISSLGQYITAKNPDYKNQLGWDVKTIQADGFLPNGATSATISMQTDGDAYMIGAFALATDLFAPVLSSSKTVTNLTVPGGAVASGHTLRYTVSLTETGVDRGTGTVLLDPIPANTIYVPGSLRILTGPAGSPTGAQTDAAGDDAAEFDAGARAVRFRLGVGANSSTGGTLSQGQSVSVHFDVRVLPNVPVGTVITNTAVTTLTGETSTQTITASASVDVTVSSPPDLTIQKSHSGSFTAGGTGAYTLQVQNIAATGTSGTVTVTDSVPSGLTATAASGAGWTCTVLPQTVTCGREASGVLGIFPAIVVTVSIAANAPPTVINTATVSGGGDENLANNTATDPTSILLFPNLSILKTHTGNFTASQPGDFRIVVSNAVNAGATSGLVTVSDPMPAGLSATAASGLGWACTVGANVSCTRSDVLASGANYPAITLTVMVAANAPSSIANTATVSGGTDDTPANNSSTDTVVIIPVPDLSVDKVHTGLFTRGEPGNYEITVSNSAIGGPTVGAVTLADPMPSGLTAVSATATGWTCSLGGTVSCTRNDVLAPGGSYPAIILTVAVAATAPATITNTATVSGGGDTTPINNSDSDITPVISSPDLTIDKSHTGTFAPGSAAVYSIVVSNAAGAGPSAGLITVNDPVPAGLTVTSAAGTGWACTTGVVVSCTRLDVLLAGASFPAITLTGTVAADAPLTLTNVATVSGGGDNSPANNVDSDTGSVIYPPDLSISKSHAGDVTPGKSVSYHIVVFNSPSAGPTAGGVTVIDTIPAGLTATAVGGSGWGCSLGSTVTCTRGDILTPGASYPEITLTASVAANAPLLITNTVAVSGGGDITPGNNSASDASIRSAVPDLTIAKTHAGTLIANQPGTYLITVSNVGIFGPTLGPVTVTDPMPAGLTATSASGIGWSCGIGPAVTCTRSDVLAAGASFPPITVGVEVAANAPSNIRNVAEVSGGGDVSPINNTAVDNSEITAVPDLTITKTHSVNLTPGQAGAFYEIIVSNAATAGPTIGRVIVGDELPPGVTVSSVDAPGWTCSATPFPNCSRPDVLAPGASYPSISLSVSLALDTPAPIVNRVRVFGGGDVSPANNTAIDTALLNPPPAADLTISKSHAGTITAPQTGAVYTITVTNTPASPSPTLGPVTVTDPMPPGLTATAAAGTGWSCSVGAVVTCTRADLLLPTVSYPPITVTVNVAANAPSSITNTAIVSGGGDVSPVNNLASDTVTILRLADLSILKSHSTDFKAGRQGTFSVVVSNAPTAGPTSGLVTVNDIMPAGLTATAASGTGWTCTIGPVGSCTRSDVLAAGASYPAITLTVNVAADVSASVINTAVVSGGGDASPANNSSSDTVTVIFPPDLSISKAHAGGLTPGKSGAYSIMVANAASAGPTSGMVTVSDTLPVGLTATAAAGTGWTCTLGATAICTRNDVLAPGAVYPEITLTVDVSPSAPPLIINTATVAGGGDATPANNTDSDASIRSAVPDLTISKVHTGTLTANQPGTYLITVFNLPGTAPTTAPVIVDDPMPSGLTATSASGIGWLCAVGPTIRCTRNDVLAPGASYPPITLGVAVSASAPANIRNVATVSGGGDITPSNNIATDNGEITAVPDLTITKTHSINLTPGAVSASYEIVVSNLNTAGPTSGTVVVGDSIPAGVTVTSATGPGWTCSAAPFPNCRRSDVLAPGASYPPITLAVSLAPDIPTPIINEVRVFGGGDVSPRNNSALDLATNVVIVNAADLTITKTHSGVITAPQTGAVYSIVVTNSSVATGPTLGAVTVTDPMPSGLTATSATGAGWTCAVGPTVTCSRNDLLFPGLSYPPITLTVNVAANAPASITNTAIVSGGGDTSPLNNIASDTVTISGLADLTILKSHSGNFVPGQTGSFTIVVSNAPGAALSAGTVTVTDTMPAGLTATAASGTGWTCTAGSVVTCTRVDVLNPGASYPPITVSANLAANAPSTITNTATVSGGGDANLTNNSSSDTITTSLLPDLTIDKSHTGTLTVGRAAAYHITVSNSSRGGPTFGTVTVSDRLPAGVAATGVSGTGWTCAVTGTVTCSRSDVLSPGSSYPTIVLSVMVGADAAGEISNTATVSGGGDNTPANNSDTDSGATAANPNLTIDKTHSGTFEAGKPGTFRIVVYNDGDSATTGLVTVSDPIPAGMTATAAAGPGWTCLVGTTVTCTRSDRLEPSASYPPITLTVTIDPKAPTEITNTVTVSGGGDTTPINNSDSDTIMIGRAPVTPTPEVTDCDRRFVIAVTLPGSVPTNEMVTVTTTVSPEARPVSSTGEGWVCSITAQISTCTRPNAVTSGLSLPSITITLDRRYVVPGSTVTVTTEAAVGASKYSGTGTMRIPDVLPEGCPVISLVTSAASYITPGQVNYGVAPGSLIAIFGTDIGPSVPASVTALPLNPMGFAGVRVQMSLGASTVDVPVFFASRNQLNAMLPSNVPLGDVAMTVSYNGRTAAPFPVRVNATNIGLFATNNQGFGPGAVQQAIDAIGNVENNTLRATARPGQIVVLWATGLGPVTGNEFAMPLPGALGVPTEVYVGGKPVPAIYSGRSGCCVGADQIHFVVPENVMGCFVPVMVKAGGVLSNMATLSIGPPGQACSDAGGVTVSDLEKVENGQPVINANLALNRTVIVPKPAPTSQDYAAVTVQRMNSPAELRTELDYTIPPVNSCIVGQSKGDGQGRIPLPPGYLPNDTFSVFPVRTDPRVYLNAGAVTAIRDNRTAPLSPDLFFRYSALMNQANESVSTFLDPGHVTMANSAPLPPVGIFNQTVQIPVMNLFTGAEQFNIALTPGAVIDRTKPLTVRWSGGNPQNEIEVIAGFKAITSLGGGTQGTTATSWFVCSAPIEAGSFTVPPEVLMAMPTGLPITRPGAPPLPWIPGARLDDPMTKISSLAAGAVRQPAQSRFSAPGIDFGRLLYILTNRRVDLDYR